MSDSVISADLLNASGTVKVPSWTSDGQGGDVESYIDHPTNPAIILRYYAARAKDLIVAARDDEHIQYIAYVLPSVSLERDDRVLVDGLSLDVVAALAPSRAHHTKLQLSERKT